MPGIPLISPAPSNNPTVSVTPTRTPSITPSRSVGTSVTPTPTVTPSISVTPSITPSITTTLSVTPTPSITPSFTPTISSTPTPTPTPSNSPDCNTGNLLSQMQLATIALLQTAVGYYKIELSQTKRNIYGESLEKWYYQPVLAKCSILREDDSIRDEMFGPDIEKIIKLTIPKAVFDVPDTANPLDGVGLNFLPEIGDIIYERSLDRYFEVHNIIIDFQSYNANVGSGQLNCPPTELVTYRLECHHTRASRLNLLPSKLI